MRTMGEGVKKSKKISDIISGSSTTGFRTRTSERLRASKSDPESQVLSTALQSLLLLPFRLITHVDVEHDATENRRERAREEEEEVTSDLGMFPRK